MNKKILLLCSILSFVKISQAEIEVPAYSDDSGLTCKAIIIKDDFLEIASRITIEDDEEIYKKELQKILHLLACAKSSKDFMGVADKISGLLCFFEGKDLDLLEDIYLNLQMRAALMGNPTAIYEILDISFPVRDESISNNFLLKGAPMTIEQFFSISEKFNEKCEERSKINPLCEVLEEL